MKQYIMITLFLFSLILPGKPVILQKQLSEWRQNREIPVKASITNIAELNYLMLYYRYNDGTWQEMEMNPEGGQYVGKIPVTDQDIKYVDYAIGAFDLAETLADQFGSRSEPARIVVKLSESSEERVIDQKEDTESIEAFAVYQELLDEDQSVEIGTKKAETLFTTPYSVSMVTRKQIEASGITSIPEALRLIPGVIVREQTAGNYDIHIRGFDNATQGSAVPFVTNLLTLVMIDYRIVYSYFSGGTFWEMLPVGLNDIERIEVIRGAASALYGPNAVTGVVNIVTRNYRKKGFYHYADLQSDVKRLISGVSAGYRGDRFRGAFLQILAGWSGIKKNTTAGISVNMPILERSPWCHFPVCRSIPISTPIPISL